MQVKQQREQGEESGMLPAEEGVERAVPHTDWCSLLLLLSVLPALTAECQSCCVSESAPVAPYAAGVLEFCSCKLGSLPEFKEWLAWFRETKPFPNLTLRYKEAVWPVLHMQLPSGEIELVEITSWKKESITEFLRTKLAAPPRDVEAEQAAQADQEQQEQREREQAEIREALAASMQAAAQASAHDEL